MLICQHLMMENKWITKFQFLKIGSTSSRPRPSSKASPEVLSASLISSPSGPVAPQAAASPWAAAAAAAPGPGVAVAAGAVAAVGRGGSGGLVVVDCLDVAGRVAPAAAGSAAVQCAYRLGTVRVLKIYVWLCPGTLKWF